MYPAPPIYLVSIPRSGATLLAAILNSHPRIAMFNEPWFSLYSNKYGRLNTRGKVEAFAGRLSRVATGFGASLGEDFVDRFASDFIASGSRDQFAALGLFMEWYAAHRGKSRWGIKQPFGIYDAKAFTTRFAGAKVIHIVRDPRSTVALRAKGSAVRAEKMEAVIRMAYSCRDMIAAAADFRSGNPDDFFQVRYEDLVRDPAMWLMKICGFIGEEYDERMLGYHTMSECYVPRDSVGRPRPTHLDVTAPIHIEGLDAWRDILTDRELHIVERICGTDMAANGYQASEAGSNEGLTPYILPYLHFRARRLLRAVRRFSFKLYHAAGRLFPQRFDRTRGMAK